MATITPSALISEIRGKVGSQIFSRNRGGTYSKSYFVPTNPNTTFQASHRAIVGNATAEWKALSQADRDAFIVLAAGHPQKNVLGQTIFWSGFNLFVHLWVNMVQAGNIGFVIPAEPIDTPTIEPVVTASVASGISINLNQSFSNFVFRAISFASAPVSPTVNYFTVSRVNYFSFRRLDLANPWNATTVYTARHGSLAGKAGMKIMFRFRVAHQIIGWSLPDVWVPVIITA